MFLILLIFLASSGFSTAQNCGPNTVAGGCVICYKQQMCPSMREDSICPFICLKEGCNCISGYYRDCTGNCVPLSQCPPACPTNEFFNCCGPYCINQELCPQFKQPEPCPAVCKRKCTCKRNYCRGQNLVCAPA